MILYEPREKETRKDYIYRVLKENIMSLELKPGELLSESELSDKLNISRTPIREVLMRLKNEHLIEVKPQAGTYVSLMDLKLINEAVFMRYNLEKEVLIEACEDFPVDLLIELEQNLYAQKLICNVSDKIHEFYELDTKFHEILYRGVEKSHVWESIVNISTHYNRMRLISQIKDPREILISEHESYLEAIKNKDKSVANKIVEKHIKMSTKTWDKLISENEDIRSYFKNYVFSK